MKAPLFRARLAATAVAALLIAACGDAEESPPGSSRGQVEAELHEAKLDLARTNAALAEAERRIANLRGEQGRDRRRIADLTANAIALERRNGDLARRLDEARGRLAQGGGVERSLRQQSDQLARRLHELAGENRSMQARLAAAYGDIQRLQTRRAPDQRQMTDLYHQGAAVARELDALRRHNAFLLQERSNLQAWLEEANATRAGQQDALRRSRAESEQVRTKAQATGENLRAELAGSRKALASMSESRDALAEELSDLRATALREAQNERRRDAELKRALAHASALADANERMARELQGDQAGAADRGPGEADGEAAALRARLEHAENRIERLRSANEYLVEKVESCSTQQQSSLSGPGYHARPRPAVRTLPRGGPRLSPGDLVAVATHNEGQPGNTRREREREEVKKRLDRLESEKNTLAKTLKEREAECAAVTKQVQTLTWANEVLVRELDAAYSASKSGLVPQGARGIYVLRSGESLSRVAKAFYGDAQRWKDLVEANKEKIPDPNRVEAGTLILIPD